MTVSAAVALGDNEPDGVLLGDEEPDRVMLGEEEKDADTLDDGVGVANGVGMHGIAMLNADACGTLDWPTLFQPQHVVPPNKPVLQLWP